MILEGRGIDYLACAQSPATNCVFSERAPDQKHVIFSAIDPIKGRGQELTRVSLKQPATAYWWALSPDGSRVAFTEFHLYEEGRIQILPLAGREARELNVKGWRGLMFLFFTADGKGLFVSTVSGTGATALYVDLEGRAQVIWQQKSIMSGMPALGVPSPSGRHLALLGYTGNCNVWLLENF